MPGKRSRLALGAVLVGVVLAHPSLGADDRASRRDADLLKQKVATITQLGATPSRQPRRTTLTQDEVNAYFTFDAQNDLPPGVVEPSVTILGTGRLSGRAVVDLDAFRKQKTPTSLLDPANFLTGRLPITAIGVLKTSNGVGRFQIESATVGGVSLPKTLLQELVNYYSRTPQSPAGINLDDSFALPAHIREIQVERGQAVIIQ